jgi:hypothetical protein
VDEGGRGRSVWGPIGSGIDYYGYAYHFAVCRTFPLNVSSPSIPGKDQLLAQSAPFHQGSGKLFSKSIEGCGEILKHTTPIKHNIRPIFKDASTTLKLQRPLPLGLIPNRTDELRAKLDLFTQSELLRRVENILLDLVPLDVAVRPVRVRVEVEDVAVF